MSDKNSRQRVVELLWQLKQHAERNQVSGVSFIHFNLMLRDADYRNDIIEKACSCTDAKLRELGKDLSEMNANGGLLVKGGEGKSASSKNTDKTVQNTPVISDDSMAPVPTNGATMSVNKPFHILMALGFLLLSLLAIYGVSSFQPFQSSHLINGNISENTVWKAGNNYLLDGLVYVDNGASLTIEQGVTVRGEKGSALIVTRDSQLYANGTAQAPIVFTSSQKVGQRQAGDWGGLVLLGHARVNKANAFIEGVPKDSVQGFFGGDDDTDSCGVLKYVRIEFAGYEVYANNELNGLTLAGCGSNTIVRYLQVHRSLDDGIEVFGGAVDLKYAVVTGAGDDGFDWDMGWRGRVQYLLVQQHENLGDSGFEGDNGKADHDALPRSAPQFYNVTLVSPRSSAKSQRGMTLRAGSGGHFHNFIIEGFSAEAIDLRDEVATRIAEGNLSFSHFYLADIGKGGQTFYSDESAGKDDDFGFDEQQLFNNSEQAVHQQGTPVLSDAARDPLQPNFTPVRQRLVQTASAPIPQGEFWNESAHYLGAIRPGTKQNWLHNWTQFPVN